MHDYTSTSKGGLYPLYIGIWFNIALIIHMVEVAFQAPSTCIQLVDLPNRTTLYAMVISELRLILGFSESLLCVFHSCTIKNPNRGFVDIVEQSLVFIVSLVTCIPSASQHVLYMNFFISKCIYIVVVCLLIIVHS